jgi:hypothetical protein
MKYIGRYGVSLLLPRLNPAGTLMCTGITDLRRASRPSQIQASGSSITYAQVSKSPPYEK